MNIKRAILVVVLFFIPTYLLANDGHSHDHSGHSHSHSHGSDESGISTFYHASLALDIMQEINSDLKHDVSLSKFEGGIGFTYKNLAEAFLMVEKGEGYSLAIHEAEISFTPVESFFIRAGYMHFPFGYHSTKLFTAPLLQKSNFTGEPHEHYSVREDEHEHHLLPEFHTSDIHATGFIIGYKNDVFKISGSYYLVPKEDEGHEEHKYSIFGESGHAHGHMAAHQGLTLKPEFYIGEKFSAGLGARFRIANKMNIHFEEDEDGDEVPMGYEEVDTLGVAVDLNLAFLLTPIDQIAWRNSAYFTAFDGIKEDAGKQFGFYSEFDYYPSDSWTLALRLGQLRHFAAAHDEAEHRDEGHEEENTVTTLSQITFGVNYNIYDNLSIGGEYNTTNQSSGTAEDFIHKITIRAQFNISK